MRSRTSELLLALAAVTEIGHAAVIANINSQLMQSDPTQLGRLSRNGIPSDWSAPKAFPGSINLATAYRFETFTVNVGSTSFIQIDFDEIGGTANLFASAYLNSYNPLSPATNYLGDAGVSGDFFGVDPLVFQVIVPQNQNVVILVNDTTAAGQGVGTRFNILVEGFLDSQFTEAPEPESWLLTAAGLTGAAFARRWRRRPE
jgi:hypothetical protein